ncbi:MAG: hypothetical protein D6696_00675 [Acidobacteria bacterium]|nr:MAG: hypothetical protein D6696_00675 [Acidobacteriota bacterium]
MKRRLNHRLYYFTVEDESLLAEAFPRIEDDIYAIAYKVKGTEDVFVTTAETKEAMDRYDVPYNCLAEEDGSQIGIHHNALSREELADFEDAIKALTLACRAVGATCIGVNGDAKIDLSDGVEHFSYFTAPAGHTFLWRLFGARKEAIDYFKKRHPEDQEALEWAEGLALTSAEELKSYH